MTHSLPPVVLVGLDSMPGIQAARILAGHKIPVIAIARDLSHYNCRTNCVQTIHICNTQDVALIEFLVALGPTLPQRAVLLPCTDMSVALISRHRAKLASYYKWRLPANDVVTLLQNKVNFYTSAYREGLPLPKTQLLSDRVEALRVAPRLRYPVVLKPPLRTPAWAKNVDSKGFKIESATDLIKKYDEVSRWVDILVAQQWVAGPESNLFSCNVYYDKQSQPVVTFTARKLRQWPPTTGSSSLGEPVVNAAVRDFAVELFSTIGFQGLGYVEMKQDSGDGNYYVLEINVGRPTGRSAIAEANGVDLLLAGYCETAGVEMPAAINLTQTNQHVKWIHLHYDFRAAFYQWRRGNLSLRDWVCSWRGKKATAIFSWQDRGPFWGDMQATLSRLFRR